MVARAGGRGADHGMHLSVQDVQAVELFMQRRSELTGAARPAKL
jgi:hypothetical protein